MRHHLTTLHASI
jgi:hypothetical protein